jgi:WD40 repeat protein
LESARKLFTLEEKQTSTLLFTSQDLLIGTPQGALRRWRMNTGQVESCCPALVTGSDLSAVLSADGQWWAAPNNRQEIELWNVAKAQLVRTSEPIKTGGAALALSSKGEYLAVLRKDGKVKVFQNQTGEVLGIRNNNL